MPARKRTVDEKLLIAALSLNPDGFYIEDLVVAAWSFFPDTFGLKGHVGNDGKPLYPDSNRVAATIMGKSAPLRKKGHLEKIGQRLYKLTPSGVEYAKFIQGVKKKERVRRSSMPRDIQKQFIRFYSSRAMLKSKANDQNSVTFFDACMFWGVSAGSSAVELEGKFSNLDSVLRSVAEFVGDDRIAFDLRKGSAEITKSDVTEVRNLHLDLKKRFAYEIAVISQRTDER